MTGIFGTPLYKITCPLYEDRKTLYVLIETHCYSETVMFIIQQKSIISRKQLQYGSKYDGFNINRSNTRRKYFRNIQERHL